MLQSPENLLTPYAPRRRPAPSGAGAGTGAGGWFDLDDWVGPGRPSTRPDIAKLEAILANSGDFPMERFQGPTGYWGGALDAGIRAYQKRNGLKVDGALRPGGPTISHMRDSFAGLFDGYEPPTVADIDAHQNVVGDENPGTIAWRKPAVDLSRIPGLPEIDQEADASNARLVRAMLRTGDIEGYAPLMRDAIDQGGKNALAEVRDLAQKLDEASPGLGGRFAGYVFDGKEKAKRDRHQIKMQGGQPLGTVQVAGPFQEAVKLLSRMKQPPVLPIPSLGGIGRGDPKNPEPLPGYVPADNERKLPPSKEQINLPNHTGNHEPMPDPFDPRRNPSPATVEQGTTLINEVVDGILPSILEITLADGITKDNRGSDETVRANWEVAKYFKEKFAASPVAEIFKQVGGGTLDGGGEKYLKETIVDIFRIKLRRPDLTHELTGPDGKVKKIYTNTVSTKADGAPTQREQGAIDDLTSVAEVEDHRVLAVPKPNQGEPMMAYIDRIRPILDDFLDPIIKEYVKLFGR